MTQSKASNRIVAAIAGLAFLLLYLPLVSVLVFSFNSGSVPVLPMSGFTFSWYSQLWHDQEIREAFFTTVKLGLLSVVICVSLSTAAALAIRGKRFFGRGLYEGIIGLPIMLPEIVIGTGLVTLFNDVDISFSFWTILAGHVIFCVGAGFRVVAARAEALPRSLEEAAQDLGRGRLGTFWFVTLPGMRSALITASLVVFALSFDQTIITIFLTGTDNTLPTLLFSRMRIGFTSELNALASVLLIFTVLLTIPVALRARPRSR
jgi:spermidine/putrescine transport system permease protein